MEGASDPRDLLAHNPIHVRMGIRAVQVVTRALKALGLRDRVLQTMLDAKRRRRLRAEARGSDKLSHPALNDLDSKLDAIIDEDRGVFVEAGANDGFRQSNTYWLERFRGWTGLLIEPMPTSAAEARRSRPGTPVLEYALVPPDYEGDHVPMKFGDLMSTAPAAGAFNIDRDVYSGYGVLSGWRDPYDKDVPARTLSAAVEDAGLGEIDLLSLDVEGYEVEALSGLDIARHAPRYILVEVTDRDEPLSRIRAMLGGRYREHSWLSSNDILFVRDDVRPNAGPPAATSE